MPASTGAEWSGSEVAAVVADYFAMFADEVAGRPYNKAERNRALQAVTGRSKGSIEFKHQNISAVLAELGLPWLRGYNPRSNYQDLLIGEVERHLAGMPGLDSAPSTSPEVTVAVVDLFVPPPSRRDGPRSAVMERLIRKFDPAERDERTRPHHQRTKPSLGIECAGAT